MIYSWRWFGYHLCAVMCVNATFYNHCLATCVCCSLLSARCQMFGCRFCYWYLAYYLITGIVFASLYKNGINRWICIFANHFEVMRFIIVIHSINMILHTHVWVAFNTLFLNRYLWMQSGLTTPSEITLSTWAGSHIVIHFGESGNRQYTATWKWRIYSCVKVLIANYSHVKRLGPHFLKNHKTSVLYVQSGFPCIHLFSNKPCWTCYDKKYTFN